MPNENAVAAAQEAIPEPEQSLAEYREEREGKAEAKPAEPGAETPKPAAASEAAKPEVQKPEEEADKSSKKLQKRFDELTREREEQRERADRFEKEIAKLKRLYEESRNPQKPASTDDPEPDENDSKFKDWNDYQKAHVRWQVRQEVKAAREQWEKEQEEAETAASQQAEEEIAQENLRQFASAAQKVASQHEDYDEVVRSADSVSLPNDILNSLILMGDEGPEIGYQLAKNPELMKGISANYQKAVETGNPRFVALAQKEFWGFVRSLSPEAKAAAAEAQKAEAAKAEVKPPEPPKEVKPKPVSQAPEPIKPVPGGSGPAEQNFEEEGTPLSEYRKARETGRYR